MQVINIETRSKAEQLKAWKQDNSRIEEFKNIVIFGNSVVIEVFKENTTRATEKVDIITGETEAGGFEYSSGKIGALVHPIGKVLALGTDLQSDFKSLKVGDILILPDYLKSMVDNPKYLSLLMGSRGNEIPKEAKGMNKQILGFQDVWGKLRFRVDKMADMTHKDAVTFLVPCNSMNIVGKYID